MAIDTTTSGTPIVAIDEPIDTPALVVDLALMQRNIAEMGKSLSAQAHAICTKIAEVDQLLLMSPALRHRVREVHPEVCFWAINGQIARSTACDSDNQRL